PENALAAYQKAIRLKPDFVDAHVALGSVQDDMGQQDAAIASYQRALDTQPSDIDTHIRLGQLQRRMGRLPQAESSYGKALTLRPDDAETLVAQGEVLHRLGKPDLAVICLRRAHAIVPDSVDLLGCLGMVLMDLERPFEAIEMYRRLLELQPENADAHNNLGNALKDVGRFDEAIQSYRNAIEIRPFFPTAHSNLLMTGNYLTDQSSVALLDEAKLFGDVVKRNAGVPLPISNAPVVDRRLNVGFVSGDLRLHPVGFFIESVIASLSIGSRSQLQLFAYLTYVCDDEISVRIKSHCHVWTHVTNLSDEQFARRILDDAIDILIDLSGHTANNRLPIFAWTPAPIQVSWLGYFATTGVSAIDYVIADPWTLPLEEEANFTEKIWRLPETRLCFSVPALDIEVAPLPALQNRYVTFASFQNLAKINDKVVSLWARILHAVPNSRLFLMAPQLKEDSTRINIIERFAVYNILAGRLILKESVPRAQYLASYNLVDIALDPFPYTGGTTTAEALWMGVPTLTMSGKSFLSRQGVGLMMNAGLPDWIALSADDYLALAVTHATNLEPLSALRASLREQVLASPIFDAPRFAHNFEKALRGMWTKWCRSIK
ncbi:MAG: tetratricopeptide repeat protein, partial [Rhodoferax sp.]